MIKNAGAKETILKVNRLGNYFCTDRITLFFQFCFMFENKKAFQRSNSPVYSDISPKS